MPNINDVTKKRLQGKISTDADLQASQETYTTLAPLGIPVQTKAEELGVPVLKQARFVPSKPTAYAQYNIVGSVSGTLPRRFRKWVEPYQIFGADVFSEGDNLSFINPFSFKSEEIFVASNHAAGSVAVSNTFLGIMGSRNPVAVSKLNYRISRVSVITGQQFDLVDGLYTAGDAGDRYKWTHYAWDPVKLLPLPSEVNTPLAYMAVLPAAWPCVSWTQEFSHADFGSALTKTAYTVDVSNTSAEVISVVAPAASGISVGDFLEIQGVVAYVDQVTTGAQDQVVCFPIHPFESHGVVNAIGDTVRSLWTVGELMADPTASVGSTAEGIAIPPLYEAPFLDWIRVRNLMPSDKNGRSVLACFTGVQDAETVGLGPALVPAKASGAPEDPHAGIATLGGLQGDGVQEVFVDYQEGIFHLQTEILDGTSLNPNSYHDSQGHPTLYATFTAYTGATATSATRKVEGPGKQALIAEVQGTEAQGSLLSDESGWVVSVRDPALTTGEYYHYPSVSPQGIKPFGGPSEAVAILASGAAHEDGPLQVFRKRSRLDGLPQAGALAFGGRKAGQDLSSITLVPDITDQAASSLSSVGRPEFRVSTMKVISAGHPQPSVAVGLASFLEGELNGQQFSFSLITDADDAVDNIGPLPVGIRVTDGVRSMGEIVEELRDKIGLAFPAMTLGEDYDIYYLYSEFNLEWTLVFEASRSLTLTTDDPGLFGPVPATGVPKDLSLHFGFDRFIEAEVTFQYDSGELDLQARSVNFKGLPLGTPVKSSYVRRGFGILDTSVEAAQGFLGLDAGVLMVGDRVVDIREPTRITLSASNRIGIYYDDFNQLILTANQQVGASTPFALLGSGDIPLYIVQTDATGAVIQTVDVRDFLIRGDLLGPITVGSTSDCRVATLAGALELAKKIESAEGFSPVISIETDIVHDMLTSSFDIYPNLTATAYAGAPIKLPTFCKIQGNGKTITVTGPPNIGTTLGAGHEDLFRADDVGIANLDMENVTIRIPAGAGTRHLSLFASEIPHAGEVSLRNVNLLDSGDGFRFSFRGPPDLGPRAMGAITIRDCQIAGSIATGLSSRVLIENVQGSDNAISNVITGFPTGSLVLRDMNPDVGTWQATFTAQAGLTRVAIENASLTSLTLNGDLTGANASIRSCMFTNYLEIKQTSGLATGAQVFVTDCVVNNPSGAPTKSPFASQGIRGMVISGCTFIGTHDKTVAFTDTEVRLTDFFVKNDAGIQSADGLQVNCIYVTGSLGLGGAMSGAVTIQNGRLEGDSATAIFVERANEPAINTVIQNNVVATDIGQMGIILNGEVAAGPNNATNVWITHNTMGPYFSDGTESYAVGPPLVGAGQTTNQSNINIVLNFVRATDVATRFYSDIGTIRTNNVFTL